VGEFQFDCLPGLGLLNLNKTLKILLFKTNCFHCTRVFVFDFRQGCN